MKQVNLYFYLPDIISPYIDDLIIRILFKSDNRHHLNINGDLNIPEDYENDPEQFFIQWIYSHKLTITDKDFFEMLIYAVVHEQYINACIADLIKESFGEKWKT